MAAVGRGVMEMTTGDLQPHRLTQDAVGRRREGCSKKASRMDTGEGRQSTCRLGPDNQRNIRDGAELAHGPNIACESVQAVSPWAQHSGRAHHMKTVAAICFLHVDDAWCTAVQHMHRRQQSEHGVLACRTLAPRPLAPAPPSSSSPSSSSSSDVLGLCHNAIEARSAASPSSVLPCSLRKLASTCHECAIRLLLRVKAGISSFASVLRCRTLKYVQANIEHHASPGSRKGTGICNC